MVQAITADSVLLKFEKAKCALEDSLKRVEDIVPQSIGCQVRNFNNMAYGSLYFFLFYICNPHSRFIILYSGSTT